MSGKDKILCRSVCDGVWMNRSGKGFFRNDSLQRGSINMGCGKINKPLGTGFFVQCFRAERTRSRALCLWVLLTRSLPGRWWVARRVRLTRFSRDYTTTIPWQTSAGRVSNWRHWRRRGNVHHGGQADVYRGWHVSPIGDIRGLDWLPTPCGGGGRGREGDARKRSGPTGPRPRKRSSPYLLAQ